MITCRHLSSIGFCHFPKGLFRKSFIYFTLAYRGELHTAVFLSVLFGYYHEWTDTRQEIFLQHN